MNQICKIFDITPQGYYKARVTKHIRGVDEGKILRHVHFHRIKMPKLGGNKLYRIIKPDLQGMKIKLGRDKFFDILRKNELLIKKKKCYTRTTNSFHRFKIYDNLIKDVEPIRTFEILVSDITYISASSRFYYLALTSDLYSRKIVGWDFSESLSMEGSLRALEMALKSKAKVEVKAKNKNKYNVSETLPESIHHSDRGLQYCSKLFTDCLTDNKMRISMAEKGNPYENAVAERINGILKDEFMLKETFASKELAYKAITEAIETYNNLRPHMSLGYMTPNQKCAA